MFNRHAKSIDKGAMLATSLPTTSSFISSDGLCKANDAQPKVSEAQSFTSKVISHCRQKPENAFNREPNRSRRVSSPAQTYVAKQSDDSPMKPPLDDRQALLESSNGSAS